MQNTHLFTIRLGATMPDGLQEFHLTNAKTGAEYTIYGALANDVQCQKRRYPQPALAITTPTAPIEKELNYA